MGPGCLEKDEVCDTKGRVSEVGVDNAIGGGVVDSEPELDPEEDDEGGSEVKAAISSAADSRCGTEFERRASTNDFDEYQPQF